MRAWAIDAYGGKENLKLHELPVPEPEAHDVLVRMGGAEVGVWDAFVREGEWPMERAFPLILGVAGAGTVASTGSGVSGLGEGDPVYFYNYPMHHKRCRSKDHNGAWAEYTLVPASNLARAPSPLDLTQSGALPVAGLTALESITDLLGVRKGELVLVTAAAGGVGHLAVQLAKRLGAHVVATASRRSRAFVHALGADTVIDYTAEDVVEGVRNRFPEGVHKALNGAGGDLAKKVAGAVRKGGKLVDLTGSATKVAGVEVISDYGVEANADGLARLARLIDEGRIHVRIEEVFPFDDAPIALERAAGKHVHGKLALEIL